MQGFQPGKFSKLQNGNPSVLRGEAPASSSANPWLKAEDSLRDADHKKVPDCKSGTAQFFNLIFRAPVRLRRNTGCFAAIPPAAGDFRDAPWRGPCSEGRLRSERSLPFSSSEMERGSAPFRLLTGLRPDETILTLAIFFRVSLRSQRLRNYPNACTELASVRLEPRPI